MKSFDFYFGVSLGELLLNHSDNLSKTLQSASMSAAEGQKIADMTINRRQVTLTSMSQCFLGRESGPEVVMCNIYRIS